MWRAAVILTLLAGLLGCESPFGHPGSHERGRVVSPERLRSATALRLREREHDDVPADDATPARRASPFEGLERVPLSLEQARAWTLERNLDLRVAMIDPDIAETLVSEEEARFESLFFAGVRGSGADPSRAEVFRDQIVRPFEIEPGVHVPLRTGGDAIIRMPVVREERDFSIRPEQYSADVEFSISHPLLRNAGRRVNTHFIRLAGLESQIASARTKLEVIRQIAAVDRAYWLLYEAHQRLQVRQEQYEHALVQLELAEARFRGRLGPEIEVVRAEAGVSRRLEAIITAELEVRDHQRTLKRIINMEGLDVDSPVMLTLTTEPDPVRYEYDVQALLQQALGERMELLENELRLAQQMSVLEFERNQSLPLFMLDYAYRIGGSGGSVGRAFDRGMRGDFHGWQVGLHTEIPIGNEAAKARVRRAIFSRLQGLATQAAREQIVKQEVMNAVDNLEATWHRILAARQSVVLEARNFRGEQGQFRLGLRTSTDVLDAETRLADAKLAEISALVDYEIARVDLAFATGTLLGASRVSW